MKFSFSIGIVLVYSTLISAGQALPRLTFVNGTIYITGLGPAPTALSIPENKWKEILSVYTDEAFLKRIDQPVAGNYSWRGNDITFEPTFPFASGATYHAIFSPEAFVRNTGVKNELLGLEKLELVFKITGNEFSPTTIESVYPESAIVPENLLRMYICFSGPMMPGEAYDHIKLYNEKGEAIEKAFLVVDQELWDQERKRLTILFDPGRIKRGLKSNLDLGPPLKEGEKYHLVVDSTWRDANGNYLQSSFRKSLVVTTAQRTKLYTKHLKLIVPPVASREALVIFFDRPMDHVLASKYTSIHDGLSRTVSGKFQLDSDNTLRFIPDSPWQASNYIVAISPLLEDVAGNNFNNVFDLDLSRDSRVNSTEPLKLEFSIKPVGP